MKLKLLFFSFTIIISIIVLVNESSAEWEWVRMKEVVFVRNSSCEAKGPEHGCSSPCARCRTKCFDIPTKPMHYRFILGPSVIDKEKPEIGYFTTVFGGRWARVTETRWIPRSDASYTVCFEYKNWKHDWDRNFVTEIYYWKWVD